MQERLVDVRPRTVLVVLGIVLVTAALLTFVYLAWHVITWLLIALFLALALNPAVEFFERRGVRRGWASSLVFLLTVAIFVGLGSLLIPPLVQQVTDFIAAVPGFIDDITAGRGPLGFLQEDYQIVDKVEDAVEGRGAGEVLGVTAAGIAIAQGVITAVVGAVAIAFITFFMLLEGPSMVARFLEFLPERTRPRWARVGRDIYRTVGGYVTGNLAISLIAGTVSTAVLLILGVPYAVALGLLVAMLDLIPLAGATIAAVVVTTVGFLDSTTSGIVLLVFFVVYQQVENHLMQP
ncbi:MAG TPA: AI-2E family transporter, partial [Gaiellaceae bacterium]|nr:AI-2E family transporter [Gaiellaceae bacterium]